MTFIPVPDGISLCFDWATAGQLWQFCLTLRKQAGSPTPTDLQDVADFGNAWFGTDMDTNIGSGTLLRQTRATDLTVQGGPERISVANDLGTGSAILASIGSPIVASLRTGLRGRSYRGRVYISGIPGDQLLNEAQTTSAYAGYIATALTTLLTGLNGFGYDVVVASKQHNGAVTNPAVVNEVVSIVVDNALDSQRRRLAGRGS